MQGLTQCCWRSVTVTFRIFSYQFFKEFNYKLRLGVIQFHYGRFENCWLFRTFSNFTFSFIVQRSWNELRFCQLSYQLSKIWFQSCFWNFESNFFVKNWKCTHLENFSNFLIQQKEIKLLMTSIKIRLIIDSKKIKFIGFYLDREKKITKQEPLGIVFNISSSSLTC
jgi:hypothetical protein